jgi:hypothetical protein
MRKDFIAKVPTYLFNLTQPGLDVAFKNNGKICRSKPQEYPTRSFDNVEIALHRSIANWAWSTICTVKIKQKPAPPLL